MDSQEKRRRVEHEENSGSSDNDVDEDGMCIDEITIDVDFDVMMPDTGDFYGIKMLLQQLFLKAHINLSELTDILMQQQKITGVVKQAVDTASDTDMVDEEAIFGVFSVLNMTTGKNHAECAKQIETYLLSHCKKASGDGDFQEVRKILGDPNEHVGLIINERMINIPSKIAVPLFSELGRDMQKASSKGQAFDFKYYILISKIVAFKDKDQKESVIYTNGEEELIAEEATISFDFSVSDDADSGLSGAWTDDDCEGMRKRRVLLFPASKYDLICSKLAAEIGT